MTRESKSLDERGQQAFESLAAEGGMKVTRIPPEENPPSDPASEPNDISHQLRDFLIANPLLRLALEEARDCGRYLITVHRKVKDSPPDDLLARSIQQDFPEDAVVDTLQGLCRSILADQARNVQFDQARAADRNQWK